MSNIGDLIEERCRDGVEFRALGDVVRIRNGKDYKAFGDGAVPVYGTGGIMSYIDTAVYAKPSVLIPRKGSLNKLYYVDSPFWTVDTLFFTEIGDQLVPRFFYYFLLTQHLETMNQAGAVPSLTQTALNPLRIPIPPLDVQREIVMVLDQFKDLETELKADLEAELEARKRQFDYYRDSLLTFGKEVQNVPIGSFAKLVRGNGLPKTDFTESGVGAIHYGQIYTHYGTWTTETKSFVSPGTATKLAKVDPGDIVVTNTSENVDDVAKAVAWLGSDQVVTGGHATVVKHHQNPRFLAYLFQTAEFSAAKRKRASGTKVIDVSASNLAKIEVPIPSLEEQERIVGIIDNLDTLASDLSHNLSAEVSARGKQYEYYRDQLLTFEEKST